MQNAADHKNPFADARVVNGVVPVAVKQTHNLEFWRKCAAVFEKFKPYVSYVGTRNWESDLFTSDMYSVFCPDIVQEAAKIRDRIQAFNSGLRLFDVNSYKVSQYASLADCSKLQVSR
jgi:hypothetical protein